jgi:hypothetical protein
MAMVCLVPTIGTGNASGSEIFHWVDEDGVLTFSDWAPENSNVEVSKLVVSNSNPPGYDPNEDQNSVLEQAERTNMRWAELKEQKEERRKEREERAERVQIPQYVEYDYPYYYGPRYYYQPIQRPGFGHRPPFKMKKRQLFALDQLGLLDRPRPHSINSSAHLARINAGKSVSITPQPRHSTTRGHSYTSREW